MTMAATLDRAPRGNVAKDHATVTSL